MNSLIAVKKYFIYLLIHSIYKNILRYWASPWRGNPIRLLLEYLNIDYEEKRYTDPNEWFEKDKLALDLDFPNLPYLIDGDMKLTESMNIMTYLPTKCKRPELFGKENDKFK